MSPRTLATIGYTRRTRRTRGRVYRREMAARATDRRNRYLQIAAAVDAGHLTREIVSRPVCQTSITRTTLGAGESWRASCACGWQQPNPTKAERYAKGAATRHLNKMTAEYCATLAARYPATVAVAA